MVLSTQWTTQWNTNRHSYWVSEILSHCLCILPAEHWRVLCVGTGLVSELGENVDVRSF